MESKLRIDEEDPIPFVYPTAFNSTQSRKEYSLRGKDLESWDIKEICFGHFLIKQQIFKTNKAFSLTSERDFSSVELYFLLQGSFRTDVIVTNTEFQLNTGKHNIYHLAKGERMCSDFHKTTAYMGLEIQFSPSFFTGILLPGDTPKLKDFFGRIEQNKSAELFDGGREITVAMKQLILGILALQETEANNRMAVFSKVVQLLSLQIEQLSNDSAIKMIKELKEDDLCKIKKAKEIIETNFQNPYSIKELSRVIGLNEFKLKKGFKEIYGATIFNSITDIRMQKAKKLLSDLSLSIGEVSDEVGYKNPAHFTVAFKKKFGILPSRVR